MLAWLGVATAVAAAAAQEDYSGLLDEGDPAAPAPDQDCYTAGSVAGAVVGTFLATLALIAAAVAVYKIYWRGRRGKHLILIKDPEAAGDQYAFDNPCFRDGSPLARPAPEKEPSRLDQKAKWTGWTSLGALAGGGKSGDKRRAQDDLCLASGEATAQQRLVTLRSRDFTGLGFNVCGNMRDGIFVRDVLHRGPAFESGRIQPGDRIEAVRISFRHMVFEDALTILSYASPYEVQLELGSASPAAAPAAASAGSLLRPRRSGSTLTANERIVHPFFRSQSSADLAQISKASLKRVQQMGSVGGTRCPSSHTTEELGNNEYPTLKLSSSPPRPPKESARFEKTAPTAVVKPERVKRASTPKQPDASPISDPGTLNKFQKFGVRVLPDQIPPRTPATEAEKHQNEQNLMKERVNTNPFNGPQGQDTVDSGSRVDSSLPYDERGIDIGPVDPQPPPTLQERKLDSSEKQGHRSVSAEEEEGHKENNVKQLLTKGLQNLKEKLHHDKKKNTGSPESPLRDKDKKQKPVRQHTASMSSDSEGLDGDRMKEELMKGKLNPREEPERIERKRQRNPEKDGSADPVPPPPDSGIPSEIPEEVRRAAVAARSNRKSLLHSGTVAAPDVNKDRSGQVPMETVSDSSSDGEVEADTGAEADRPPKRSNKRKAPPPPAEDVEGKHPVAENTLKNGYLEEDINISLTRNGPISEKDGNALDTDKWAKGNQGNSDSTVTETGTTITTFANLASQKSDTSAKDVTNITIDDGASNILASLASKRNVEGDIVPGQSNSFPADSSSSGTSTMETKTVDFDNGIHVTIVNSDSDSDLERLEGDDDMFEGKRSKKGGTTIELNSSHITIHHSPSSDTMQMAAELESDSTRKAASLGDLSRLDSEQPMSILERAVSLDLGDGGTPHSSKKRKAPLPPPGEDYLTSTQDTEDGAHYRKEPRLDNAMDTFQRRRLKKSSDWGTLEEALKQTDNPLAPQRFETNLESSSLDAGLTKFPDNVTLKQDIQMETLNLADDQKVKLSDLSQKFSDFVRTEAINISGIEPLNDTEKKTTTLNKSENMVQSGRSSPECDHGVADREEVEVSVDLKTCNLHEKRTVLLVSPQLTEEDTEQIASNEDLSSSGEASQIKIVPSSAVPGFRKTENECVRPEANIDVATEARNSPLSAQIHTGSIISSTPLPNRESTHTLPHSLISSSEHSFITESVQSPLVTSSDAGISNIHVSSTTQELSAVPSQADCTRLVSSASDHFVTATASMVDSTTAAEELSDNEATWGSDLQPPELPTSPVPILPQTLSSFAGSPSMTYITEIQVVTTTDSENDPTMGTSNLEITPNGTSFDAAIAQGVKNNRSDLSLPSDSIASGRAGNHEIDEENPIEINLPTVNDTMQEQIPKTNVTVTSIRTNELDNCKGQGGGRITEATLNHVAEKKPRSVRPPVPPRRSELSSPSSSPPAMSSSTIMVEVPKIRLAETTSSNLLAGGSVSQVNPAAAAAAAAAAGKFISFSSLSPRTEGGTGRHSSSFEQWVFLDESPSESHHNGFEITDNGQHSSVMALPSLIPNRSQTVTHIILDTKQNNASPLQD